MYIVGEHYRNIFVVLTGEHGVFSIDLSWKDRHSFILGGWTVQRQESEMEEVTGLHQFRQDNIPIERRKRRVITLRTVVLLKPHEPGILNPVPLRRGGREQDAVG